MEWRRFRGVPTPTLRITQPCRRCAQGGLSTDTIRRVEQALDFVEENQPDKPKKTRDEIVVDAQMWALAFSEEGKAFAAKRGAAAMSLSKLPTWLEVNYPLRTKKDPVPARAALALFLPCCTPAGRRQLESILDDG